MHKSAKQAINTTRLINNLFEQDCKKVQRLGRARFSCKQTLEYMKQLPQVTIPLLTNKLNMTAPTVRGALNRMVKLDILEEKSGKQRDKIYISEISEYPLNANLIDPHIAKKNDPL